MIVTKSVRGPSGYPVGVGFTRTVGEVEEIHVTSGKMVAVFAASSCNLHPIPTSVSGNIVTVEMFTLSGPLLTASTVLSSVELVIIADGY